MSSPTWPAGTRRGSPRRCWPVRSCGGSRCLGGRAAACAASEAAADEASMLLADGPRQLAASLVSLAQRLTDPHVATGHVDAGKWTAIRTGTPCGAALESSSRRRSGAEQTAVGPRPRGIAHRFFGAVHPVYGLGTFSTFYLHKGTRR